MTLNFVVVFNNIWIYIFVFDTESLSQTYLRNFGAIDLLFAKKLVFINTSLTARPSTKIFCMLFIYICIYICIKYRIIKKIFFRKFW